MNKNLIKLIEGLGYSTGESTAYIACLELAGATNAQIAQKTKLNRITNYEILKRLQKKGIVKIYKKSGSQYFSAIDPRILINGSKQKAALAEQSLPEILSLVNKLENKPKIYFYEGKEGIKNIYHDSLSAKNEILTFTNPKDLSAYLGQFIDDYVKERVKNNIRVKGIGPDDEYGRKSVEEGIKVLRESRLFDKKKYSINNEIMIYNNKVALYSSTDEVGIVIENKTINETFKNIWEMLWDSLV